MRLIWECAELAPAALATSATVRSAVSQTGYGLMAIVAIGRSDLAVPALLFFLLAYVPANLAAFGVVVELRGRTAINDYTWLAVVAAINTVVSIFYYVRVLAPAYFGALAEPVPVLGRTAAWATLTSAGSLVLIGIAAEPFMAALKAAALLIR